MDTTVSTAKRYRILCVKHDGRRTEFARYARPLEAEQVSARLTAVGCTNVVEDLDLALGHGDTRIQRDTGPDNS